MIGRTYLERGKPVVVLVRWAGQRCPRNVLIQREDGTKVVRPFRGLRRITPAPAGAAGATPDGPDVGISPTGPGWDASSHARRLKSCRSRQNTGISRGPCMHGPTCVHPDDGSRF